MPSNWHHENDKLFMKDYSYVSLELMLLTIHDIYTEENKHVFGGML